MVNCDNGAQREYANFSLSIHSPVRVGQTLAYHSLFKWGYVCMHTVEKEKRQEKRGEGIYLKSWRHQYNMYICKWAEWNMNFDSVLSFENVIILKNSCVIDSYTPHEISLKFY